MKKNLKRTLAKVMAVALTVSLLGTAADADAAKKIKLAKKSITVTKGKSKKVAIKNVKKKQVKKLTVKSSKKKVATVKKAGKTAIKVTGKKKGSAKITVKVTLKGKKKATKLTLKVKVQNAKKPPVTPTTAPTAVPTAVPSQNPTTVPSQNPTTVPSQNPTNAPEENKFGVSDPYVITISEDNEAYANSVAKRLANGQSEEDATARNKDPQFNADGSVTFTSTNEYNSGMTFYIDPDVKTTQNDDGTTAYEAKKVDLTNYEKVRFTIKDAYLETSLKVLTDGNSWWSKGEKWEGQDNMTEGDRVVEYELNEGGGLTIDQLKEAEAIGLAWHNTVGETGTIVKIELVGKRTPLPIPDNTPTPIPSQNPTQSPTPTKNPDTESGKIESGSVESGSTESGSTESGKTETPVVPEDKPLASIARTSFTAFSSMEGLEYDATACYGKVVLKYKAYDKNGAVIDADHALYGKMESYEHLAIGNVTTCTDKNGEGYGAGMAITYLNNIGKQVMIDEDGLYTCTLETAPSSATDITGIGCQVGENVAKVEIVSIELTKVAPLPADVKNAYTAGAGFVKWSEMKGVTAPDSTKTYSAVKVKFKAYTKWAVDEQTEFTTGKITASGENIPNLSIAESNQASGWGWGNVDTLAGKTNLTVLNDSVNYTDGYYTVQIDLGVGVTGNKIAGLGCRINGATPTIAALHVYDVEFVEKVED